MKILIQNALIHNLTAIHLNLSLLKLVNPEQQLKGNFDIIFRESGRRSSACGFHKRAPPVIIPPQRGNKKGLKTLVLDLDETLIHSSFDPVPNPDYIIPVLDTFTIALLRRNYSTCLCKETPRS